MRRKLLQLSDVEILLLLFYSARSVARVRMSKIVYKLQEELRLIPTSYEFTMEGGIRPLHSNRMEEQVRSMKRTRLLRSEYQDQRHGTRAEILRVSDEGRRQVERKITSRIGEDAVSFLVPIVNRLSSPFLTEFKQIEKETEDSFQSASRMQTIDYYASSDTPEKIMRFEVELPLYYNDGTKVEPEKLTQVGEELLSAFGGYRQTASSGGWLRDTNVYRDENKVYICDVPQNERAPVQSFLVYYKRILKQRFKQIEINVTEWPNGNRV